MGSMYCSKDWTLARDQNLGRQQHAAAAVPCPLSSAMRLPDTCISATSMHGQMMVMGDIGLSSHVRTWPYFCSGLVLAIS